MESTKVNLILTNYKDKIPPEQILNFKNILEKAPDSKYDELIMIPTKSVTTTLLFSIFLGGIGVDRFYIGDVGLGVAKLFLGTLTLGIWPIIDIFMCYKKVKEKNFQNFLTILETKNIEDSNN